LDGDGGIYGADLRRSIRLASMRETAAETPRAPRDKLNDATEMLRNIPRELRGQDNRT